VISGASTQVDAQKSSGQQQVQQADELRIIQQEIRDQQQRAKGQRLFLHQWISDIQIPGSGDGLGPMRNAASCVECHLQGKVGGGGPNEKNVDLLSVVPPKITAVDERQKFAAHLPKLHGGLSTSGTAIVLHRYSNNPDYDAWKTRLLGVPRTHEDAHVREYGGRGQAAFKVSQRNTPALFGAGLIDTIPASVLATVASEQGKQWPGVSGRVARTPQGGVGRFGWRGQTSSLRDFVLAACATELGLEIKGHSQAVNPQNARYKTRRPDLNESQCDALVAYVASLPQPVQIKQPPRTELVESGATIFKSTGCVACHTTKLAAVDGIYSDLLLHDMGVGLADPVGASPEITTQTVSTGGYYGGTVSIFAEVPSETLQEWRTPPLWGVRDSGPYLHDGRAKTIEQAILWHGGEAEPFIKRYRELPEIYRARLLAFLNTLTVTDGESLAAR